MLLEYVESDWVEKKEGCKSIGLRVCLVYRLKALVM
jgi:hypothetical protein